MSNFCPRNTEAIRPHIRVVFALSCCLFLTQCGTTSPSKSSSRKTQTYKVSKKKSSGTYKKSNFSQSKLSTPSGHGMSKKQYPFDDQGNYRRDWVRSGSSSRTKSSRSSYKEPTSQVSNSSSSSRPPSSQPSSRYPSYVGNTAPSSPYQSAPALKPTPSAKYHKVASGDTLYSLSRKYGVSVSALQKTNGLSSNLIRTGQSLRIP